MYSTAFVSLTSNVLSVMDNIRLRFEKAIRRKFNQLNYLIPILNGWPVGIFVCLLRLKELHMSRFPAALTDLGGSDRFEQIFAYLILKFHRLRFTILPGTQWNSYLRTYTWWGKEQTRRDSLYVYWCQPSRWDKWLVLHPKRSAINRLYHWSSLQSTSP